MKSDLDFIERRYIFNLEVYQAARRLDHHTLQEVHEVQSFIEQETRDMIIRCKMYVATTVLQNETKVVFDEKYDTLWDHFKDVALPTFTRWFKWRINRTKKEIEVKFKRIALFPDIPIDERIIKEGRVVVREVILLSPINPGD